MSVFLVQPRNPDGEYFKNNLKILSYISIYFARGDPHPGYYS